jgi:hypothetical protein
MSREIEFAETLLKLSRVPFLSPFSLELKCGMAPIKASLENHPKHPGTGSKEIMTWVDRVNELHLEATCLSVSSEVSLMTGPVDSVELRKGAAPLHVTEVSAVNWEDKKRTVSECEETIEVEVPEPKKSRKTQSR